MFLALPALIGSVGGLQRANAGDTEEKGVPAVLSFRMKSLAGEDIDLARYSGRVALMVNVASKCGYTPQYAWLQKLHEKYADKGLAILGFPANEFGGQEPGTDHEIQAFCKKNYGVTFDMFSKVVVKGEGICPLYQHLTSTETGHQFAGEVMWNFEKFLLNRKGEIVGRFRSRVEPTSAEMVEAIEAELERQ
ncbi:MAG: glutathione peroxidase [Armatimonadetes bacterium CG2_30_59_28]|nr:glutathione peroxidase [Armatimonadota bacterium]OIO98649.1 MAG: glutathione peroxidase [Armatimonadetes bacterium CG2_30_59_28]PIU63787.1 MAG: glutathione peroxidase [Armatimonadetes bacterium CG07_land_8_20_14_0_80_59_28]PIX39560.1 MAG: glutathione peroxidase [Armatimonadetes bacterium CG_4_8_14_3_um_filter_58_9]PIY38787.1 MAG: glutathione peroxidase [Armatimonadetes bacterium CG_4_10_14_3_um_filter_59_10]PJB69501.1 MAG: glutathione peroxidase [Armatimonadetes bacterium CG_4_9_14_3_um_fil